MLNLAMEFYGFKFFKKEFKFKSKKEYNQYFNNALIESPFQFIRLSKEEFNEKIHIALSWMAALRIASWALMGMAALGIFCKLGMTFGFVSIGLSVISMLVSNISKGRVENLALGKSFSIQMYEMNNYENLEEVRQELIKEKNNNDETPE
jgi:hypothetical protein